MRPSPYSSFCSWFTSLIVTLVPAGLLYYLSNLIPEIAEGASVELLYIAWVPWAGLDFRLVLDGFSLLFSLLIVGIGLCIQLYSIAYMQDVVKRVRLQWLLFIFMGAMLGLVWADHLMLMFIFWELTSLSSYLLIGFNHQQLQGRENAQQALLVTAAGALFMLAGLILLGESTGTYSLQQLISTYSIQEHGLLSSVILLCILAGCFTKSAQFPMHFWLPNAMHAPTPVSAYLHSATMVKAGIFLLARFWPIFSDHFLWSPLLITAGVMTMLTSAVFALRQHDLKLKLAFTTLTILGQCTVLLGMNTEAALHAFMVLLVAHALYKASMFMVVGVIDHHTGTRHIYELEQLMRWLPLTTLTVALAAFSKAGVPPFLGFLGKEMVYASLWDANISRLWLLPLFILANAAMVTVALLVAFHPFYRKNQYKKQQDAVPDIISHRRLYTERQILLWLMPLLLAVGGLITLILPSIWQFILLPAIQVISPHSAVPQQAPVLWHGITWPLIFSVLTLSLGLLLYCGHHHIRQFLQKVEQKLWFRCETAYFVLLRGSMAWSNWFTERIQRGLLVRYVSIVFSFLTSLLVYAFWTADDFNKNALLSLFTMQYTAMTFYGVAIILMTMLATLAVVLLKSRLAVICALGAIGFNIALLYLLYSAPDVAMTQFLVETLVVVIIVVVMRYLPPDIVVPPYSRLLHGLQMIIPLISGLAVAFLALKLSSMPLSMHISDYFAENSVSLGHGKNIVNVILVNFRALDTMGEVTVVMLAGLAALTLIRRFGQSTANVRRVRKRRS